MAPSTLLWFKRDLRVQDHPAVSHAADLGHAILPLYIIEPDYWRLPDSSARQWAFVAECLTQLRSDLATLGAPLIIRSGTATDVLENLRQNHSVTSMISHEETGNAWTYTRDKQVAAWAKDHSVLWIELAQSGVKRRLATRDQWTAGRQIFTNQKPLKTPIALKPTSATPGAIQPPDIASDPCPHRQLGGRAAATTLLNSFLTTRGEPYQRAMSSPIAGETACSRLSPHLAFGTLSGREAQAAKHMRPTTPGSAWAKSLKSFEARLAWRDHFMQKLEDEPAIETHCMHRGYEGLRPLQSDPARLHAWEMGETGLPFVDACLRYTRATGWLNFRMRAMVTAVAAYHLWLDWRSFGPILARYFTDYEPGIHWSQLQMQSGTTGINTVRLYNPIKQGLDWDKAGTFTRRWCPELHAVPLAHLQTPWTWENRTTLLNKTYPAPIIDVASAARTAKDAVYAIRKDPAFGPEAARVVTKHASRKHPRGLFQRDGTPRTKFKKPNTQLSFDL